MKLRKFIIDNRILFAIISCGILLRFFFIFFFNHIFDFFNILAIVKSVADTQNVTNGFYVLKDNLNINVQLYGKIYYQVAALWIHILNTLHVINIDFIFDLSRFDASKAYMTGFGSWGPLHYQLLSIKLVQFIYDFILLYYLIQSARLLYGTRQALITVTLFWAITPYLVYPSYVPFQSDLAMLSCLTGGIYYALCVFNNQEENQSVTRNKLFMCFFLALGAVIKQVPVLFIIPLLIILTSSIYVFLSNSVMFAVFYVTLSQPWAADAFLFKKFFLISEESTAIINFTLNGASIFIVSYLLLLLYTFFYRSLIRQNIMNILKLSMLIFSIIFISEDLRYLFAQFAIWTMPTIALIMIGWPIYSLVFIGPIVGFYRWIIVDNSSMTSSLWLTLGRGLEKVPSSNSLIESIISPNLVHTILNSIFIFCYLFIFAFTIRSIHKPHLAYPRFNPRFIVFGMFIVYLSVFVLDLFVRSQKSSLVNIDFTSFSEKKLSKNPEVVYISNPDGRAITGITPMIYRKKVRVNDSVILRFTDPRTNREIHIQRYNDMLFPEEYKEYHLPLDTALTEKNLKLEIYKERGFNDLILRKAAHYAKTTLDSDYGLYDNFYRTQKIGLSFPSGAIVLNVEGPYTFTDALSNFTYHLKQKPSIYFMFFSTSILLAIVTSGILTYEYYMKKN